jgi:hypothetical protein
VKNPIQGRKELLEGFHSVIYAIQRSLTVENVPQMRNPGSQLRTHTVEMYRRILVFQAKALRHLKRRLVGKILSNTFSPSQWSDAVKEILEQEDLCDKVMTRESQVYLAANQRLVDKLRKEIRDSFQRQEEVLQVCPAAISYLISGR